jgi:hypothetical protein
VLVIYDKLPFIYEKVPHLDQVIVRFPFLRCLWVNRLISPKRLLLFRYLYNDLTFIQHFWLLILDWGDCWYLTNLNGVFLQLVDLSNVRPANVALSIL